MRLRIAPRIAAVALAASLSGALPCAGHAQELLARADSLMNAGRVFAAESIFYYMVRRDPRNPAARLALGRYLAARGALKVGAVLMEEARYFGGDPATVANALVPVYEQLGDYASLAALPASPLDYAERRRAEWLGKSLAEKDLAPTALRIMEKAEAANCAIILPVSSAPTRRSRSTR